MLELRRRYGRCSESGISNDRRTGALIIGASGCFQSLPVLWWRGLHDDTAKRLGHLFRRSHLQVMQHAILAPNSIVGGIPVVMRWRDPDDRLCHIFGYSIYERKATKSSRCCSRGGALHRRNSRHSTRASSQTLRKSETTRNEYVFEQAMMNWFTHIGVMRCLVSERSRVHAVRQLMTMATGQKKQAYTQL